MWGGLEAGLGVAGCLCLVLVLAACVCGCRKDTHKSELVGTAGVVKLRFEEGTAPPAPATPSAKRASAQNSQRSLPEIPELPRQDSGDTASELYATVGTNQRVSEQSSPTVVRRSDHPYEHAYARLQDGANRTEDPVVVNENPAGSASGSSPLLADIASESQSNSGEGSGVVITASVAISGQVSSSRELPYMTPPVLVIAPTAQPQHFSGDSVDSAKGYTSISVREPLSSIRANLVPNRQQPHYATVSDDSDEMYAAIEDPSHVYTSGSETYAQIQPAVVQALLHAAPATPAPTPAAPVAPSEAPPPPVPSTSEPAEAGSSKKPVSEGAARQHIPKHSRQASNSSCNSSVGPLGSPKPEKRQANSPLPPPPAVLEGSVAAVTAPAKKPHESPVHTKIASQKQRISSTGDLHNNPDKLRRSLNEKHQRNNSCVSSSDFYGCNYPVDKHRFSSGDLVRPLVARELNFTLDSPAVEKQPDAIYNTIDGTNDIYAAIEQDPSRKTSNANQLNVASSPSKNVEEMYAKVVKKSKHFTNHVQERSQPSSRLSNYDEIESARNSEPNFNTSNIPLRKKSVQHEEDRLSWSNETKRYSGASPTGIPTPVDGNVKTNPSQSKNQNNVAADKEDPGYETIDRIRNKHHGYETIDKNVSKHKISNDPGYETVKETGKKYDNHKRKSAPSISSGLMQHSHNSMDLLQRITLQDRNSHGSEPGYEVLPSGPDSIISNDPGYEHINRSERCPSESDPNYEVLRPHNASTPPYASIQNKSQVPGYSIINKKPKVPESNWMANNNECSTSEPNYESMPHEALYNTGSESDPNYESVGPKDPNYESVKYFDVDPPYEKVQNDANTLGSHFQRTGSSSSGYERVKSILKHDRHNDDKNDNRPNGTSLASTAENAPVADYFQV